MDINNAQNLEALNKLEAGTLVIMPALPDNHPLKAKSFDVKGLDNLSFLVTGSDGDMKKVMDGSYELLEGTHGTLNLNSPWKGKGPNSVTVNWDKNVVVADGTKLPHDATLRAQKGTVNIGSGVSMLSGGDALVLGQEVIVGANSSLDAVRAGKVTFGEGATARSSISNHCIVGEKARVDYVESYKSLELEPGARVREVHGGSSTDSKITGTDAKIGIVWGYVNGDDPQSLIVSGSGLSIRSLDGPFKGTTKISDGVRVSRLGIGSNTEATIKDASVRRVIFQNEIPGSVLTLQEGAKVSKEVTERFGSPGAQVIIHPGAEIDRKSIGPNIEVSDRKPKAGVQAPEAKASRLIKPVTTRLT